MPVSAIPPFSYFPANPNKTHTWRRFWVLGWQNVSATKDSLKILIHKINFPLFINRHKHAINNCIYTIGETSFLKKINTKKIGWVHFNSFFLMALFLEMLFRR